MARGLFTGPSAQVTDDMYARIISGRAHRERYALHLEQGATVDTNTYFGRLPASYFQRWTTVTEVQLKLVFDTSSPARLLLRGSDIHGGARTIDSTEVDGTGTAVLSARLNEYVDGGALWMECTAVGGPLTITDLEWTAPAPADDPARRDRHLHLQQGRRLRDQRRRRRRRQGSAGGHRRDLRRRPGHRCRRDPAAVQRRRRATRRQAGVPAAAEPRWRGRLFAGHVRDLERRRSCERDPDGRRHPLRTRDDPAAQRLREPDAVADDRRRADALPEEHPRTARQRRADADDEAAGGPMGAQRAAQLGHDQVPAAQARRRRIQRVVVMPDPVGGDRRDRPADADVLPVGRHRIRAARVAKPASRRRRCPTRASGTPTSTGRTATSSSGTSASATR